MLRWERNEARTKGKKPEREQESERERKGKEGGRKQD